MTLVLQGTPSVHKTSRLFRWMGQIAPPAGPPLFTAKEHTHQPNPLPIAPARAHCPSPPLLIARHQHTCAAALVICSDWPSSAAMPPSPAWPPPAGAARDGCDDAADGSAGEEALAAPAGVTAPVPGAEDDGVPSQLLPPLPRGLNMRPRKPPRPVPVPVPAPCPASSCCCSRRAASRRAGSGPPLAGCCRRRPPAPAPLPLPLPPSTLTTGDPAPLLRTVWGAGEAHPSHQRTRTLKAAAPTGTIERHG
jgi:hypothetical protein